MVKRLLALLVAVALLTSWFAVPVFASDLVRDSGAEILNEIQVLDLPRESVSLMSFQPMPDLSTVDAQYSNSLIKNISVANNVVSLPAGQLKEVHFRVSGGQISYGSGYHVFRFSFKSSIVPYQVRFVGNVNGVHHNHYIHSSLFSTSLGVTLVESVVYVPPDSEYILQRVDLIYSYGSGVNWTSSDTLTAFGLDLADFESSGFTYSSGSMTANRVGSTISVSYPDLPAGDYMVNIYHKSDGCNPVFNLRHGNKYLETVTSGGVTTAYVHHTGGNLSLSGWFWAYRATSYQVTGGESHVSGSVSGSGYVDGDIDGSGYVFGSVYGSGDVTGSSNVSGGIIDGSGTVSGVGNITGSSSVAGEVEGESSVSGTVVGESSVSGSVSGSGIIYVEDPAAWSFTIADIVVSSVSSSDLESFGVLGGFMSWLSDQFSDLVTFFGFQLEASEARTDAKMEEAAKPSTDQAIQTSEDKVDEYDEISEGYNTQADAALAEVHLDAISVPSDFTGAADLLGYVFLNAFQANTMLQFLVIINLAFALVTVIIRR